MDVVTASGPEGQPARRRGYRKRRRLRQFVQLTALVLFVYLLLGTRQGSATWVPHDVFFRLDPLAGLSTMLAGREWLAPMAFGLVTLATALVFGRAWCGWICPVGAVLDWTPARRAPSPRGTGERWLATKYILLAATLVAAAFGSLTLLVLDPITLLFRTSGSAGVPLLSLGVKTVEGWVYAISWLRPALDWFDGLIRGWLLTEQPAALTGLLLLAVFGAVMGLNAIRRRFWCRYLCPLGALLALTSRIAWLRYFVDAEKCTSCGRCATACGMAAIDPAQGFRASIPECTTCLDCAEACPTGAIAFRGEWQAVPALAGYRPARREFLGSLGLVAAGAAFLGVGSLLRGHNPLLIRPPGVDEEHLLRKCIRCGECSRVCPTGGL
ncbi:MAG: 4Fe-4S binding protein, partial [Planctomycetota bacterium]